MSCSPCSCILETLLPHNFWYMSDRDVLNVVYRGKTNFFEKRVGDYQKSGVMGGLTNTNQHTIAFDEDF